jgi:hypothetical protein
MIDSLPVATVALGAAEGNFSGEPGAQHFKEVLAVRPEGGFALAKLADLRVLAVFHVVARGGQADSSQRAHSCNDFIGHDRGKLQDVTVNHK